MAKLTTETQTAVTDAAILLAAVGELAALAAGPSLGEGALSEVAHLDLYLGRLEWVSERAGDLGYPGLQEACLLFQEKIQARRASGAGQDDSLPGALAAWPELMRRYLQQPPGTGGTQALVDYLALPIWAEPLAPDEMDILQAVLRDDREQAAVDRGDEPGAAMDDGPQGSESAESPTDAGPAVAPGLMDTAGSTLVPEPSEEDLSPQIRELIAVLLEEIPLMEESLAGLLEAEVAAEGAPPEGRGEACEIYADYLERFGAAAESVGFAGLGQVVARMRENLGLLALQSHAFNAAEMDLLAAWSGYAGAYLNAPYQASTCQELLAWLQAPDWPQPLSAEQAQVLLPLLQAPSVAETELDEAVEVRPQIAALDQVSLDLPEDVNPELLDALLQEMPGQTQTFSAAIQNLIAGGSLEDVNTAQRTAHTLKGAANTVGIRGLANLTHHIEDILVALAKHQALPTQALAATLMGASDCLEAMSEALCGIGAPPDHAQAVLQEILDWANRIDREGLPPADPAGIAPADGAAAAAGPVVLPTTVERVGDHPRPATLDAPEPARGRVATGLVDDLLRLGGETIILSGQVHEQVRRIEAQLRAMQAEFTRLQQLGGDLERLIDIQNLNSDRHRPQAHAEFDALEMDQYNDLHSVSRMLVEAATDAHQIGGIVTAQMQRLDQTLLTQERLHRETQEKVLSARMVPIKTLVSRLQRGVRQTCRLTGKQVELHVRGADTLMDSEVLNGLIEPLMHVLRNAVDHGIEAHALRSAVGKPEQGTIWLDFLREGNRVLVRCRDDGVGLDLAAIRRAAEERGLLRPGSAATEEELTNLLLLPGFSTRSEVTQTSGRGMGLDVVYAHVLSRGGSLTLKSEAGKGSTTELQLPVSLISTHAVLARLRGRVVAIADRGIEQILHGEDGQARSLGDQPIFQVGQRLYPLKHLDEILQLPPDPRLGPRAPLPVLLVKDRSGITAITVQEVVAGIDLVVKELGHYVPRLPGIIGATILGDGTVTPVLDLPELLNSAHRPVGQAIAAGVATEAKREARHLPLALVVDDSLSARRALVQVMEDAGYEVRAARDGLEAVERITEKRPDIVLADMEMPRMNGIELTTHLRARPETADLPLIMISSRSTAKHRQQAAAAGVNVYLTKPFLDDELLEQVTALRGRT